VDVTAPKIQAKGGTFSYDRKRDVFSDIAFSVEKGEVFAILGPNGTGKSTLLRCICRLQKLDSGSIQLDNINISKFSIPALSRKIGFVPQVHSPVFPYTVIDVVLMGRASHLKPLTSPTEEDYRICEQILMELNISRLKDHPYNQLSEGEMQLVILSRALAQQPEVLLLDEPTAHLDAGNQMRILQLIKKLSTTGLTVIMTTHYPDQVFIVADKVGIMKNAKFIAFGRPDEVMTEENLKQTYDTDIKIINMDRVGRKICVPVIDPQ
jgi:iron complex transport system ATP-binding protein